MQDHAELFVLTAEQCEVPVQIDVIGDGQTAQQALERMAAGEQDRPDAVMLDLNLPRVSGLELLRQVRGSDALGGLPVVVTSCSYDPSDVQQAADLGVAGYLAKPIHQAQLCGILQRLAARR